MAFDDDLKNGCYAGEELTRRRLVLLDQEVARVKRLGNQGEAPSNYAVFAPQGDRIAFVSASSTFAGPTENLRNIFIKDLSTGAITRVSSGPAGAPANGNSERPRFSEDGNRLVFDSDASNLVAGDTNGRWDVFIRDLRSGSLQRFVATPKNEEHGSSDASFSNDGTRIAFISEIVRPPPGKSEFCATVKDLRTNATMRLTYPGPGATRPCTTDAPAFLPDGRRIVFPGDDRAGKRTLFALNLQTGATTELLGDDWRRQTVDAPQFNVSGMSPSRDGTRLVFTRWDKIQGKAQTSQVFIFDVRTGQTALLVPGKTGLIYEPDFSPDGNRVAFVSDRADLVDGDTNRHIDVFMKDLRTGHVQRISTGPDGAQANGWSQNPRFSPDGTRLMFMSNASNLVSGDTNGVEDVFIKDLASGAVTRVSVPGGGARE